ncbi:MAG: CopG family transcriptional regulator [Eubacteriales bacterium]|nr:CopG family transcriptional regulator [Eubacteriales bacterium]
MAELKKVLISMPDNLLKEIDNAVSIDRTSRSEFVRKAMKVYLKERSRLDLRGSLRKGYEEMAELNLSLSEAHLNVDIEQLDEYEHCLREME